MFSHRLFQKQCCQLFLEKLYALSFDSTDTETFKNSLNELHTSFLRIRESFVRFDERPVEVTEKEACGEVEVFRVGTDDEYPELECKLVGISLLDAVKVATTYSDYENRKCNLCGRYFLPPFHSSPTERVICPDFVLAAHLQCLSNINKYF